MERRQVSNSCPERFYEEEIDLFALLEVLWRRRFLILVVTLLAAVGALAYVFLSPSQYLIQAQVKPRTLSAEDFKNWFSQEGYRSYVAQTFPKDFNLIDIAVTGVRKGSALFVRMYYPDPGKGKKILAAVLDHYRKLLEDQDRGFRQKRDKLQRALKEYEEKLAKLELERNRLILEVQGNIELKEKEKDLLKNVLFLHKDTVRNLQKVINSVQSNTHELAALRTAFLQTLSRRKAQSIDQLTITLYSSIIQQNLSYLSSLEVRLLALKKEGLYLQKKMDTLDLQIAYLREHLANLNQELDRDKALLRLEKEKVQIELDNLQPFDLPQPPISSPCPVKPKRTLVVSVAGILGLFLGIFVAFLLQALEKRRSVKTAE